MAAPRLILAALCALLLAACRDDGEPAPAGRYEVDAETGTVTASARVEDGEARMVSGPAIAEPLPVALPLMPGASVVEATHVTATNGMRRATIRLTSEEPTDAAMAFYRTATREAGLSHAVDLAGPDGATLVSVGPDRERATIHVALGMADARGRIRRADGGDGPVPGSSDPAQEGAPVLKETTVIVLSLVAPPEADRTGS